MSFGLLSHAIAAVAFAALALLLLTRWREHMRGSLLIVAVATTVVWAVLQTALVGPERGVERWLLLEIPKTMAWLLFLTRALSGTATAPVQRPLQALSVVVASLAVLAVLLPAQRLASIAPAHALLLVNLIASVAGFVLAEQAFRNTRAAQVWAVKFLWIGVGAIFAYDVLMYSLSYSLDALDPTLVAARGLAVALSAPLIAIGVVRVRNYRPQALMSPRLAFYTGSIVVAGCYLVVVALVGYYVRALGGSWGRALEVVVLFGALIGLVALTASGWARAWLRVFIAKHFLHYKYDFRSEWLALTERLTRNPEDRSLADRAIDAFARIVRANGGGAWVRRDQLLAPVAGVLVSAASEAEPISSAFCRHVAEREWVVDLDAARAGRGRDAEVPVPAWLLELKDAWLAVPLLHQQQLVGLIVLGHSPVSSRLTWEDLDLLRTAGRQAASYFALENAAEELAREQQFAAVNRFTAFLMHDLSNIVAQQRLIVENAARHRTNPAFFDDAIATIDNTVSRTARLLEQLKIGASSTPARRVELATVCAAAVARVADREPRPVLDAGTPAEVQVADDRLEHVLVHVLRNAQDATEADGAVHLRCGADGEWAVIEVEDTGRGMDAQFVRDRLFRPFDTTKGARGMGVGAFQAREFVRAAGGDVEVRSAPGRGTTFVLRLPLAG